MYATWEYYLNTWEGLVTDRSEFKRLARKASAFLDSVTFYNIDDTWAADDRVRDACCAMVDLSHEYATGARGIASESTGSESISYKTDDGTTEKTELALIARQYLGNTGLLYRGLL